LNRAWAVTLIPSSEFLTNDAPNISRPDRTASRSGHRTFQGSLTESNPISGAVPPPACSQSDFWNSPTNNFARLPMKRHPKKAKRQHRFLLLADHLAKRVGFRRQKTFGRNRVTKRGHNPIYLLAAEKCGLPIGCIHTEVSERIAPILSANCFWLCWIARRALAKRDRELRKIET
jgi:hypothetical protein